jgi:hypothetical protein
MKLCTRTVGHQANNILLKNVARHFPEMFSSRSGGDSIYKYLRKFRQRIACKAYKTEQSRAG